MTKNFVLAGARVATMDNNSEPYGLIPKNAVVVESGQITWVGPQGALPDRFRDWPREDLGGRLITPGLIDAHTHVVFGGNRAVEFEMRLNGASYEEIARAGGGILSTVNATRAASEEDLLADALPRVDALLAEGVGCIEVKSGYGLEVAKTADVSADEIVVHDAALQDPAYAFALSRLSEQNLDHMVMGIFRQVSKPTYDDAARQQIATARDSRAHDTAALQALLRGKDTWTVD